MPFPFLPGGALVAGAVLLAALTAFGLGLRAINRVATRAASELRLSIVPGVVSGLRRWGEGEPTESRPLPASPSAPASNGGIEIIDLEGGRSDER
jgi:hypothetical protein